MRNDGRLNAPGTGEYPENARKGAMIVMLPGYGPLPSEKTTTPLARSARGLITSPQIDRGPFVPRLLAWLRAAGVDTQAYARYFRLCTWCERLDPKLHGPQMVKALAADADHFLAEVTAHHPALIVFMSCYLHDAVCEPSVTERLGPVFGRPLTPPRRLCDTRLRAQVQRWERTLMIGLPVPGQNATPAFAEALAESLRPIFEPLRRESHGRR
jgi:hypothetical protein